MKSSNSLLLAGDTLWKCDWGLDNGRRTWILGYGQVFGRAEGFEGNKAESLIRE